MKRQTSDAQSDLDTGEIGTQPKLSDARVQDISLAAGVLIARNKRAMFGESSDRGPVHIKHAAAAVIARMKRDDVR
jgi:hypothetical protein